MSMEGFLPSTTSPLNVHVGSNTEHIAQGKHGLLATKKTKKKTGALRCRPSGLAVAGADADDVTVRNTWATVSVAHINKATLASLGSRSSCRCQCAESHGLAAL